MEDQVRPLFPLPACGAIPSDCSFTHSKDYALGTPEIEIKVREATSNEPWGPTTPELQYLAQASFS